MSFEITNEFEKIETYNQFLDKLNYFNLKIDDLYKYGLMKTTQLRMVKKKFKINKDDKKYWQSMKNSNHAFYYLLVIASPKVAYSNKQSIIKETKQ